MVIPLETRAEILRLFYAEHFTMNAISEVLGVHHDTVNSALNNMRVDGGVVIRPSILDPYLQFIKETIETYPKIRATRIHDMIESRGYKGSTKTVRNKVAELRPQFIKAYLPLVMMPAEQAQVDWGHFGKIEVEGTYRKLSCFAMVQAYSRMLFAMFTFDQTIESFLRCHIAAFRFFQGVARKMVYDNLKSVVLDRVGKNIRFNPTHLEFAGHYHFKPEACNVRAGWEKGRVERSIRFIRDGFIVGRHFKNLDDANRQMQDWLVKANNRPWPDDRQLTVADAFAKERDLLLKLPENDFSADYTTTLRSGKIPFIRYDLNDYSIPSQQVRKPLTLIASQDQIRIVDGDKELARHQRSYGRGKKIRNEAHFADLLKERLKGAANGAREQVIAQIPEAEPFFALMIEFDLPTGEHIRKISTLIDDYGKEAVRNAIIEATEKRMPRATTVAQILHQQSEKSKEPPKIPLILPANRGIENVTVTPHDLASYDELTEKEQDNDE